jgi:hypothetical protein
MGDSSPPPAGASNVIYRKLYRHLGFRWLTVPSGLSQVGGALVGFSIPLAVVGGIWWYRIRKAKKTNKVETEKGRMEA